MKDFILSIVLGCLILFILTAIVNFIDDDKPKNYNKKVKELECNTVFVIQDSTQLISKGDTVWVNMTTLRVDTRDTVAMMCIVLN